VLGAPWKAFLDMSSESSSQNNEDSRKAGISLDGFTRAVDYLQLVATRKAIQDLFIKVDAGSYPFAVAA